MATGYSSLDDSLPPTHSPHMTPEELHVYDLDGTLYRSPKPPTRRQAETWWFHAHSFGKPRGPGLDSRWVLSTLVAARHSEWDPRVRSVLLTGRPDHNEMQEMVQRLVALCDISFDHVLLRPLLFPGGIADFKASAVRGCLERYPSVKSVVLYDDDRENRYAVEAVVRLNDRAFQGVAR